MSMRARVAKRKTLLYLCLVLLGCVVVSAADPADSGRALVPELLERTTNVLDTSLSQVTTGPSLTPSNNSPRSATTEQANKPTTPTSSQEPSTSSSTGASTSSSAAMQPQLNQQSPKEATIAPPSILAKQHMMPLQREVGMDGSYPAVQLAASSYSNVNHGPFFVQRTTNGWRFLGILWYWWVLAVLIVGRLVYIWKYEPLRWRM